MDKKEEIKETHSPICLQMADEDDPLTPRPPRGIIRSPLLSNRRLDPVLVLQMRREKYS